MAERANGKIRANRTLGLAIAGFVLVLDQLVKWLVIHPLGLPQRRQIDVLPFFRLEWVNNPGVSMGFLPAGSEGMRWFLVALTVIISLAVLFWLWREKRRGDTIALGLVLGGALGNIFDRVRLGHVIDFANFHVAGHSIFLVFNVGDAAITIGVLLLIVRALIVPNAKKEV